ncbi:hypothetical protein ORJ04_17070 [Rheinheimera baltica]|uniref:Orphan protein n=1 Tax=Rheinheimera baltica TaxID=67576 RepID=A0ABT9I3N9_9GAMM|nr:hypothetical protein [Rheinheimera baltica]MDP5137670.1 hypothetical protein [Rheinheimera baltica]
MNARTLINTAVITLCLSNAVFADDMSNLTQNNATETQVIAKDQPTFIALQAEQVLAELKQDLSKSIQVQVSATLSSLADTIKNML